MNDTIVNISAKFVEEAKASPRMLEDLAAMEKYMSESYDGRTFVELIQNADDANSNRIKVDYAGETLIVANDGREFDENDIVAICRSGASNKQRGKNIGYRGVGFKSATTISTEIIIYSAGVYFTFSKSQCAEVLNMDPERVPTVRIPFLFNANKLDRETVSKIEELESDGFTTFFIFREALINKFREEIAGFNSGWLLFLRKVCNIDINLPSKKTICKVIRKKHGEDIIVKIVGEREQWYITEQDNVSLAFKYEDEKGIVACDAEDAVFHCYLPTIDKTGFPFKVNADFSTDPSRKHIIADEITQRSLAKLGLLYVNFISKVTESKDTTKIAALGLLGSHISLGDMVSKLENEIEKHFRTEKWILKKNGEVSSAQNITYLPNWMEAEEKSALIEAIPYIGFNMYDSNFYSSIDKFEKMASKYGAREIDADVLRGLIVGPDSSKAVGTRIIAKIFVYCYRGLYTSRDKMDEVFIPTANSGYVQLSQINEDNDLDGDFLSIVSTVLNSKEKTNLSDNYKAFASLKKQDVPTKKLAAVKAVASTAIQKRMAINKWKTPIQNCLAVESLEGRSGRDVSRKCDEYDVESVDARGNTTYISVKQVKAIGDTFSLSEGEYAAAQRLGEAYRVFVISLDGDEVDYIYLNNPIETLSLDKVVKEWEFLCNTYSNADKPVKRADETLIDQRLLKNLLPEYFNSKQKSFLIDFISLEEMDYSEELKDLIEKINAVVDFYTGMVLLEVQDNKIRMDVSKLNTIRKILG
ncbi:MAG: DUF3883 domain-containing protein [Lachnospira sp.]